MCETPNPIPFLHASASNKWSKNFDERPHRRGRIFHGGDTCSVTPGSRQHCSPLQQCAVMPLSIFAAYNAAVADNVFQWSGQPPNLPLPIGRSGPHLIHCSLVPHESAPKQHLDRFSRFCRLTNVTNRQTYAHRQTNHATPSVAIGRN